MRPVVQQRLRHRQQRVQIERTRAAAADGCVDTLPMTVFCVTQLPCEHPRRHDAEAGFFIRVVSVPSGLLSKASRHTPFGLVHRRARRPAMAW